MLVVTRAGRLQEWLQGELQLHISGLTGGMASLPPRSSVWTKLTDDKW